MTTVSAVDLFSGVGGLSLGLKQAGLHIAGGIDIDSACAYPYERNIGAPFLQLDVEAVSSTQLEELWGDAKQRVLAGCAPCQPFSSHRRGADTSAENNWNLLSAFGDLVTETMPHFVTMENVTRLRRMAVFQQFVSGLENLGYAVVYGSVYGPDFGLPQSRRRLVLIASRIGAIEMPKHDDGPAMGQKTVLETIGELPPLQHGETDPADPLHSARRMSELNLRRMRASRPGGTWKDWPVELRSPCHRRATGLSFGSFYGRMQWNQPAPTITTQSYNFGTGRFGHPAQDRSITLREAAMLQGFPADYVFTKPGVRPAMSTVGRLIGNAVPPAFGKAVGDVIIAAAAAASAA